MTITGLDLSLRATGWCELQCGGDAIECPVFGTRSPPRGLSAMERLAWICAHVMATVTHAGDPDLVVIEGFSYGSRGRALFEIAGLGYAVRLEMFRQGMRFVVIPPTTLKKFVTGKGTAQKSMMLREVYRRWGIDAGNDNEADAVGLAQIGAALLDYSTKPLTAFQRDVIGKLKQDADIQATLAQFEVRG